MALLGQACGGKTDSNAESFGPGAGSAGGSMSDEGGSQSAGSGPGDETGGGQTIGSEQGHETVESGDPGGEGATPGSDEGVADDTGARFDVGNGGVGDDAGPQGECAVVDDMNAVPECKQNRPPDSFAPEIQWSWLGGSVVSVPLVANLTDDNGDNSIDLCDSPDVVVIRSVGIPPPNGFDGQMVVLDGKTGAEHFVVQTIVSSSMAPAIGDIDDDGIPEIVAAAGGGGGYAGGAGSRPTPLVAFENDGTLKWTSAHAIPYSFGIALADLDNDNDVEIIVNSTVTDHNGALVFVGSVLPCGQAGLLGGGCPSASTAADLDGDKDLEIIDGNVAYHHDGTLYYQAGPMSNGGIWVWPQVANLDADADPEVLIIGAHGDYALLEHDGKTKWYMPVSPSVVLWYSPAHIHDFDGDRVADFGFSTGNTYEVHRQDGSLLWAMPVMSEHVDSAPGGTAFDFIGGGKAQAIYNDQKELFVYDGAVGTVLLQLSNATETTLGFPIVADVDDDGSAEILIFSSNTANAGLHAIRDKEDRWIQARRIWNQHTYHVTNVREDGTIPQYEAPHWKSLNTFRTNAQIEGGLCIPPQPEG